MAESLCTTRMCLTESGENHLLMASSGTLREFGGLSLFGEDSNNLPSPSLSPGDYGEVAGSCSAKMQPASYPLTRRLSAVGVLALVWLVGSTRVHRSAASRSRPSPAGAHGVGTSAHRVNARGPTLTWTPETAQGGAERGSW